MNKLGKFIHHCSMKAALNQLICSPIQTKYPCASGRRMISQAKCFFLKVPEASQMKNCSAGTKYLVGEAYNLLTIESIDSTWGEEVDKEKGSKIIFTCKQSVPMAFYEGAVTFDPSSASW